jgi:hypothetical protein
MSSQRFLMSSSATPGPSSSTEIVPANLFSASPLETVASVRVSIVTRQRSASASYEFLISSRSACSGSVISSAPSCRTTCGSI